MKISKLEKREELRQLLYHVRGILELQERLSSLLQQLNQSYGEDRETTETVMGALESELFFHLPYHLRELRGPFEGALKELYGEDARIVVDESDKASP